MRYRDIMNYEIRIAPELYQYKILKLTLQPLVENSLYHGIKYKRAKGNITVTGTMEEGNIHFRVEDDGVGMEEEELANLRREIMKPCKDTGKGFGLANVNERIRMNFGAEYGMTIDSERGKGTCVEIVNDILQMSDYRVSQYGNVSADDQISEIFKTLEDKDTIVIGAPVYWYTVGGILKTFIDRLYMLPEAEVLKGKKLYF